MNPAQATRAVGRRNPILIWSTDRLSCLGQRWGTMPSRTSGATISGGWLLEARRDGKRRMEYWHPTASQTRGERARTRTAGQLGAASAGAADVRGRQAAGGGQGSPVGAAVGFGGRRAGESRGGESRGSRPDLHEDGVSKGWSRRLSMLTLSRYGWNIGTPHPFCGPVSSLSCLRVTLDLDSFSGGRSRSSATSSGGWLLDLRKGGWNVGTPQLSPAAAAYGVPRVAPSQTAGLMPRAVFTSSG